MNQEEIDILMKKIDKKCKLPKNWDKFIEKHSSNHYLIIKDNKTKELFCTNCEKTFNDKTVKVGNYIVCPHCKKESKVYGVNYYRKSFEDSVILVQRLDKQIIIRVFEIYSYYEKNNKKIHKHWIEYVRILPKIGKFIGSNVDLGMYGNMCVYHGYKKLNWYKYNGYRGFSNFPVYPYNKKKLIKDTNLEYAPINEFLEEFSYYSYNYLDVLQLAAHESFELLWKMNLHNLCFYAQKFNKGGSFQERFGVPKSFLKFMQDNNISYRELLLLQLFQKADIKILNKYKYTNINYLRFLVKERILDEFEQAGNSINSTNIKALKEIKEFIPLRKLKNYSKGLSKLYIYRDYLKMSKELLLNYKSKKDLFPRNLIARHDKLQKRIKINEDMRTQFSAYLRYLELSKYTYKDDKYIIFPAPSIDDLKDESSQQGNCVYSAYSNSYINGQTEIYFIRNLFNPTKSFITLEYKNNRVIQKELPHHNFNFTNEQLEFIDKWIDYRRFMNQKEKYKNKQEIKVVKYKFKKMAA